MDFGENLELESHSESLRELKSSLINHFQYSEQTILKMNSLSGGGSRIGVRVGEWQENGESGVVESWQENRPRVAGVCWGEWGRVCESRGKWWSRVGSKEMDVTGVVAKLVKEQVQYFFLKVGGDDRIWLRLIDAVAAVVEVAEANNLYTLPSFHYPRQHDIVERSS
nr:hypothetical protein [Tanacetum cinerariifolium]